MRKLNQKGITLVALVITIIVLLILAGITISLTIGDRGIFNKTQQAALEHEKAQLKEELELEILDIQTKKQSQGKQMLREDLQELTNIGATMENFGIPAEGEYKDYFFEVDENYVVTIIGKLKGEKPTIQGEVITQGIVENGGKVEIKVTANISQGNIKTIEAINGATLKINTSATEKVFEVSTNGIYYFKTTADNGRTASVAVEVKTIERTEQEIRQMLAQAITQKGVPTNPNDSFSTMLNNLRKVKYCIVQEGQTSTISLGKGGSTTVSVNFTNTNDRIPIINMYQKQIISGKFPFYFTQPVVTAENFKFTIWNGSGYYSGSTIIGWRAIYLGNEEKDIVFEINNIKELKTELSQIITYEGIQTQEDVTAEEMINNIRKIKRYEMEEGEISINNLKPRTGALSTINFQKEYENPPMVIFEEKSKVGSWIIYHGNPSITNLNFTGNKYNSSTTVTGSAVVGWKAITVVE